MLSSLLAEPNSALITTHTTVTGYVNPHPSGTKSHPARFTDMSVILFALLVILVLALALYAVRLIPGIDPPISVILQLILVILAIVLIVQRAGLF